MLAASSPGTYRLISLWLLPSHDRDSAVGPRIAYMPQGLGKNLYLELSVHDNVDFMARLFGLPAADRKVRVKELLEATGLGPFADTGGRDPTKEPDGTLPARHPRHRR